MLDTAKNSAAESLYRSLGYIEAGSIADFATDPDGNCEPNVYYYKLLP
jgi:hypothetical protein